MHGIDMLVTFKNTDSASDKRSKPAHPSLNVAPVFKTLDESTNEISFGESYGQEEDES